jgi:hypothetical protein
MDRVVRLSNVTFNGSSSRVTDRLSVEADSPLRRADSATRAGLRQEIYDLLYDENTGFPASKYNDEELEIRTDDIFKFFEQRYTAGLML